MDSRGLSILIADEASHVRSALRFALNQATGVTIIGEAADTQHAVALAQEWKPDLVLLQWELPGRSDSSSVAALKAAHPGLAVVATSARLEARGPALRAGAEAFVSKLEPPERLLAAVRDCEAKQHSAAAELEDRER